MKVFRITSKFANKSSTIKKQYYEIKDWKEAGLKKPSWIDIGEAISFDLKDLNPKRIGASNYTRHQVFSRVHPKLRVLTIDETDPKVS